MQCCCPVMFECLDSGLREQTSHRRQRMIPRGLKTSFSKNTCGKRCDIDQHHCDAKPEKDSKKETSHCCLRFSRRRRHGVNVANSADSFYAFDSVHLMP